MKNDMVKFVEKLCQELNSLIVGIIDSVPKYNICGYITNSVYDPDRDGIHNIVFRPMAFYGGFDVPFLIETHSYMNFFLTTQPEEVVNSKIKEFATKIQKDFGAQFPNGNLMFEWKIEPFADIFRKVIFNIRLQSENEMYWVK